MLPTKVYVYFADVVMWFPPILSRVEYPSRPSCRAKSWIIQQPGPFSVGQTAR